MDERPVSAKGTEHGDTRGAGLGPAKALATTERARLLSQIDMQALDEQLTGGHASIMRFTVPIVNACGSPWRVGTHREHGVPARG